MLTGPPPPVTEPEGSAPLPPPPTAAPAPVAVSKWKLAVLGGVGLAGCAYLALYDPNKSSSLYPACPFKAMTGLDCPGCGITRAAHSLLTGDLVGAADHNLLFVLLLPLLTWWFVRSVRTALGRPPKPLKLRWRPWMTWASVVVVIAWWVLRNLPFAPFHWLNSASS